ncbi:MAG TPA: PPK2 family polyphosphate kinase [Ktedonobacteraceae bacterium]|nr:PPK2 family polyphosphate kinase [Ktedonobacteraceae bacterium]
MSYAWKIDDGKKVSLADYDHSDTNNHHNRDKAEEATQKLSDELSELQELMAAAQHHSLLVILQGTDTSGKDGTIRHVLAHVNPQGCSVVSFKEPTQEELAHDFLWRIHKAVPGRGAMGIFNRSQYEDVLIARVHNLVPESVWSKRYQEINHFERLLANNNTIILKFFLHIGTEEQARRLLAREQDKDKAWKLSSSDWSERKFWKDYQQAYEDALTNCSTKDAPWYIVPSDHKWYRNLAVAHTMVHAMRPYENEWRTDLEARGRKELDLIEKMRAAKS